MFCGAKSLKKNMLKPMDLRHRAEAYPPTGLYHNLLRLRWGAGAARDPEGGVLPGFHGGKMVGFTTKNGGKWWFNYGKWWKMMV